jgi:DNA anti-recombination protein RmuC
MGNDMRKLIDQVKTLVKILLNEESKGLWANIQAKKERGEEPAKK